MTIETLTGLIGSATFKSLIGKLSNSLILSAGKQVAVAFENFGTDFEPHLQANFDRCLNVKTILNKAAPISLLEIYVNTDFSSGKNKIDDYDLIESIHSKKRILITGTGGGGKTMFMKYLWLSLFADPKGKMPVFVELRRLNDLGSENLMSYIYHSIVDTKSKLTEEYFKKAANDGLFVFILDGFDEVSQDKIASVQDQILKFCYNNPKATVIVSGRPSESFETWQPFINYRVAPLTKAKTLQLIKNLPYDEKIKRKFSAKVKNELFTKHESFLSNPLLATMMLLTFDQFAEIPEKIYLFYDQAFDTLYLRHDFTKEGFKRDKSTALPIDEFKKYLSYFSLASYYDQILSFSEADILAYAAKSFIACNITNIGKEDFVKDLIDAVCIMQRDGLQTVFTHRSFQEYFAAYCLANYVDEQFAEILANLCSRRSDSVISMLLEMKKDKTEKLFILKELDEINMAAKKIDTSCIEETTKLFELSIKIFVDSNDSKFLTTTGNYYYDFILLLVKSYNNEYKSYQYDNSEYDVKDKAVMQLLKLKFKNLWIESTDIDVSVDGGGSNSKGRKKLNSVPISSLRGSGIEKWLMDLFDFTNKLQESLQLKNIKTKKSLDAILGLTGG